MQQIFEQLALFDNKLQETPEFKAATYSLMVLYCETRRSRSMMEMVTKRMEGSDDPSKLDPKQDKTKNMWKSFSRVTIELKRDGELDPKKELLAWCWTGELDFKFQKQLIGVNGELLIAKQDAKVLRDHVTKKRFDEEAMKAKRARPNSTMFTVPTRFIPNWLLDDWSPKERAALGFPNPRVISI